MEAQDMHEFMQEDGHNQHTPSYSRLQSMFTALQAAIRQDLDGNEGIYSVGGKLFYGDDMNLQITPHDFETAAILCGVDADYLEEWTIEFCDGNEGRSWAELED